MKTLIAKFCMWVLGKLGYNNRYVKDNEIVISVDTREAVKSIQRLSDEMQKLKIKQRINGL